MVKLVVQDRASILQSLVSLNANMVKLVGAPKAQGLHHQPRLNANMVKLVARLDDLGLDLGLNANMVKLVVETVLGEWLVRCASQREHGQVGSVPVAHLLGILLGSQREHGQVGSSIVIRLTDGSKNH